MPNENNRTRNPRAFDIFCVAQEHFEDEGEQRECVAEACANSAELRREVEELLKSNREAVSCRAKQEVFSRRTVVLIPG